MSEFLQYSFPGRINFVKVQDEFREPATNLINNFRLTRPRPYTPGVRMEGAGSWVSPAMEMRPLLSWVGTWSSCHCRQLLLFAWNHPPTQAPLHVHFWGNSPPLGLCTLPGSRCVTKADSLCSAGQVGVLSPGAHSSPHRGSLSLDSRKAYTGAHPCSGPNLTQSQAMV